MSEEPCERQKEGMTDNCALCENTNHNLWLMCLKRYRS